MSALLSSAARRFAGCYTFPKAAAAAGSEGTVPPPRALLRFEGMFNGRPRGKGMLFWEDGDEVRRRVLALTIVGSARL